MTPEDAIPILSRWIAELQTDLADARYRIAQLEAETLLTNAHRYWLDRHTPAELYVLAREIDPAILERLAV